MDSIIIIIFIVIFIFIVGQKLFAGIRGFPAYISLEDGSVWTKPATEALFHQYELTHHVWHMMHECRLNTEKQNKTKQNIKVELLSVPRVHTTFASCGFSVAAPSVWNSLPVDIRACSSPHTSRRLLKTHCFDQAFSSP